MNCLCLHDNIKWMALQKNHNNSKIWELRTVLTERLSLMRAAWNARTLIGGDSGGDSSDVGEDNAESHDDFIFVVITSKHSLILPIMPVISLTDLCQDCPLKSSFLRLIFSLWDFAHVSVFWHWMFLMLLCLVCSEILSEGGLWTGTTTGLMFHICCEHTNCSQDSGIRGSIKLIEITGSGASFCPDYIGRNGETKKLLSRGLAPVTRRCGDQAGKNVDTFRHVIMSSHTKLSSPASHFGLDVKTFWHLFLF